MRNFVEILLQPKLGENVKYQSCKMKNSLIEKAEKIIIDYEAAD